MIYFDNAATTFPKPRCVADAVREAFDKYGANPGRGGHDMSVNTAMKVYECRQNAAKLFSVSNPEKIVFTQNCTHALNTVLKGFLMRGDHVLISDMEHNSVVRPLYALNRRFGIEFSTFPIYEGDDERTCYECRRRIRRNTALVECTHASNVFGIKTPAKQLCQTAHRYGAKFLLDAAQTAGIEEIPFDEWNLDYLCTAGHKGLYGPTGTGLLIAKNGKSLRPLTEGGSGTSSLDKNQPEDMPEHLESGTVNTVGIIGLNEGISYLLNSDRKALLQREIELMQYVYDRLNMLNHIELYTAYPQINTHVPVLSFNIKGYNSEIITSYLNDEGFALRGGYHCAPSAHKKYGTLKTGTCRMSIGIFNTADEVKQFSDVLENIHKNDNKLAL